MINDHPASLTLSRGFGSVATSHVNIRKAIITAAGKSQRTLPLQSLVDRDGQQKPALAIIIEEILRAGIEDICIVVYPGDGPAYMAAAAAYSSALQVVEQPEPLGYGHAVFCGRDFVDGEPFLLVVGDHLYISRESKGCAQQLVEVATSEACSVSAVQATHESKLPYYGAVGGKLSAKQRLYEIDDVVEKPTPTQAEQRLIVPGLRAGNYLCFFGMHVLTPIIMKFLAEAVGPKSNGPVHLTAALARLRGSERYLACEVRGRRYDIGLRYGLLTAQLALALEGQDREEVLGGMVELLAARNTS